MTKIEIGKLWPFGKKEAPKASAPLSWNMQLSDEEKSVHKMNCGIALAGELTVDQWRVFVDGMARLHQGTGYHDGTVFAEAPCGKKVLYFQTTPHAAQIKIRSWLGAEIITWGRTYAGKVIEAPTLTVIRKTNPDPVIDSLTFKPENSKPKKSDNHGSMMVENYDMSPEENRRYCAIVMNLFNREEVA